MKTLSDTPYHTIIFDAEKSVHSEIVKAETINMSEPELKVMLEEWKKSVFETTPQCVLVDNRELNFPISPDLQEWITENISQPVQEMETTKKFCFVMPEDFISSLSISQLTNETNVKEDITQVQYFSNKEEAEAWLRQA